jgi:hypothetical protein
VNEWKDLKQWMPSAACGKSMPDRRHGLQTSILQDHVEEAQVPSWKVLYRDDLDQDRTSRGSPSQEAALERARQLYLKERAEIYRIEGPGGLILHKAEIMRRLSANKGQNPAWTPRAT